MNPKQWLHSALSAHDRRKRFDEIQAARRLDELAAFGETLRRERLAREAAWVASEAAAVVPDISFEVVPIADCDLLETDEIVF